MTIETSFEIKIPKFKYIEHETSFPENHKLDSEFKNPTEFFGESIIYFYNPNNDEHYTQITNEN